MKKRLLFVSVLALLATKGRSADRRSADSPRHPRLPGGMHLFFHALSAGCSWLLSVRVLPVRPKTRRLVCVHRDRKVRTTGGERQHPSLGSLNGLHPAGGCSGSLSARQYAIRKYLDNEEIYKFAIYPFYGYPGWTTDVIRQYGSRPATALSDDELYGTARAYGQAASDLLWKHGEFSPDVPLYKSKPARAMKRFVRYARRDIECLHELYLRNPGFRTMVGRMDLKYANEIMAKWYEMSLFGPPQKAGRFLRPYLREDTLYDSFWTSFASAMLEIPEPGAILFTNGDNDTYPLLYLHEVKHIRPDIRIVNLSLLNDPVYYQDLTRGRPGGDSLWSDISPEVYEAAARSGIYIGPGNSLVTRPLQDWNRQAVEQVKSQTPLMISRGIYRYHYTRPDGRDDHLDITTNLPNVIFPARFILPSLILSQFPSHPVYFSKGCIQMIYGLIAGENLAGEVLVYRLAGEEETKDPRFLRTEGMMADTTFIRHFIDHSGVALPENNFPARQRTFSWITNDAALLIRSRSESGDDRATKDMVREYFSMYPPAKCGVSPGLCDMLNLYFGMAGKTEQNTVDNMTERVENAFRQAAAAVEIKDDDITDTFNLEYLSFCISLLTDTHRQGPPAFYRELEKIQQELRNKMAGGAVITVQ